ncbi:ATP-binding protein [Halothiobacillus sp. 15-55-196]|uniref:ATP-binding protein n=1 Tax=Halothiobacillus sp. 15-55-196 TaxID=1970382 RepID=UPI0025C4C625|nr:ATP-binding protein [Halothiobacillus sp. 15-55-196]
MAWRIWPRSLFGQVLLMLTLGIVAALALSLSLLVADRARLGERLLGDYAIQRIAQIIQIQNDTAPDERRRLARWMNTPLTHLMFRQPWHQPEHHPIGQMYNGAKVLVENTMTRQFAQRLHGALEQPIPIQVLAINGDDMDRRAERTLEPEAAPILLQQAPWTLDRHWQMQPPARGHREHALLIQARLDDGSVLTLRHALPPPMRWPFQTMGWLLLLGGIVITGVAWILRRLTQPLDALVEAAVRLPQNLNQAPLTETGPNEVSRAAQAFNQMQRDIQRLIEVRGHALAGVSHDLRLPITRMRLRLAHLPEDELKQKIENDLTEMDEMIGHTLAFLRAGTTTEPLVSLDLDALLDLLCEDMTLLGAQIRRHGAAETPVKARPQALQRALQNVLDNARRYSDDPVDLSVEVRPTDVVIRIEDRGPGIPEADRERIFEPYVRLETSRARHTGGSGLGLAIARASVRAQGGDIQILAREGGGTRVEVTLMRKRL